MKDPTVSRWAISFQFVFNAMPCLSYRKVFYHPAVLPSSMAAIASPLQLPQTHVFRFNLPRLYLIFITKFHGPPSTRIICICGAMPLLGMMIPVSLERRHGVWLSKGMLLCMLRYTGVVIRILFWKFRSVRKTTFSEWVPLKLKYSNKYPFLAGWCTALPHTTLPWDHNLYLIWICMQSNKWMSVCLYVNVVFHCLSFLAAAAATAASATSYWYFKTPTPAPQRSVVHLHLLFTVVLDDFIITFFCCSAFPSAVVALSKLDFPLDF